MVKKNIPQIQEKCNVSYIWSTKSALKVCYNSNNGVFEHDAYNSYDVAHDFPYEWMKMKRKVKRENLCCSNEIENVK